MKPKLLLVSALVLLALFLLARPSFRAAPEPPLPETYEGVDPEVAAAIRKAADAVRDDPNGSAFGRLAQLYHAHEYFELARRSYRTAGELSPEDPRWSYHLGVMAAERGENELAIRHLRATLRLDGSYVPAHVHLGDTLAASGELRAATAAYSRALELEPDHAWALAGRGRITYEEGRTQDALADLEKSVAGPDPPRHAIYQLALAYRDLGRPEDARRQMDAYRRTPGAVAMPDQRMREVAEQAQGLFGRLREARAALAAERYEEAQAIYEQILQTNPREFSSLMNLANLYFRQQHYAEAAALLERAVEVDEDVAHAHFALASSYLALERFADGERELVRVLELEPGHRQAAEFLERLRQTAVGQPGSRR